jgi:hypothetical protein
MFCLTKLRLSLTEKKFKEWLFITSKQRFNCYTFLPVELPDDLCVECVSQFQSRKTQAKLSEEVEMSQVNIGVKIYYRRHYL